MDIADSSYYLLFSNNEDCFEVPIDTSSRNDVTQYFSDGHNYDKSGFAYSGLIDVSELNKNDNFYIYLKMIINNMEYVIPLNK